MTPSTFAALARFGVPAVLAVPDRPSPAAAFLADADAGDPDCLITDMQMPGMTGAQLLEALVVAGRRFPVIVMTAFPSDATRQRVLAAGALAYLVKPVDGPTVARCIDAALARGEERDHT